MKLLTTPILFITKQLLTIHEGSLLTKLKSCITLAISASPFILLLDQLKSWAISNIDFMTITVLAIIIDHIIGSCVHAFKLRDFNWKQNAIGLFTKVGLTVVGYILFESLNFILKDAQLLSQYFKIVTNLTVFLYPAGSAFVNMSVLTNGKFPPIGWIEKIQRFQTNLSTKEFSTKNERHEL